MHTAISGLAGSGKDTVGRILSDYLGMDTYALADPIKLMLSKLTDTPLMHFYEEDKDNIKVSLFREDLLRMEASVEDLDVHWFIDTVTPITSPRLAISIRELLQVFGTDHVRNRISQSYWVDLVPKTTVIITDVRFPDELTTLRSRNPVYHIHVREANRTTPVLDHESELHDAYFYTQADARILNKKDGVESLKAQVLQSVTYA